MLGPWGTSGQARGFHLGWGRFGVSFCDPGVSGDRGCSVAEASGGKGDLLTGVSQKKSSLISGKAFQVGQAGWT